MTNVILPEIVSESYRDLFEHSLDCICIHTLEGTLLSVNPAFVEAFGAGCAEELIGTSIRRILTPNGDRSYDRYIAGLLRDGKAVGMMEVLTRSGEVRMFEYRNTLRMSDGEMVVRGMARDVTARLSMLHDLRSSEKRFRVLFEDNLAGVALTTARGKFLDLNAAALRMIGVTREQCLASGVADYWIDREACRQTYVLIRDHGAIDNFEVPMRRGDGTPFWALVTASVIERRDDGNDILLSTIIDISDRRALEEQARAALRIAERERTYELLRTTIETTGDGMLVVDEEQRVLIRNGRVLDLRDNDPGAYARLLEPAAQDPSQVSTDLLETRDGRILERVVRPLILDDESGGQVICFRDVTERERRAERMRRDRATLARIAREWTTTFNAVPHPIIVLDDELVVRRVNRALCTFLDCSRGDVVGRPVGTLADENLWFTITALCNLEQDVTVQITSGVPRRVWDVSISVSTDEEVPGSWRVVILRDVTSTHELQQSLRRSETMSAMGELVAGVSHQLRNPLFCISAALDAFEARAGKDGPHRGFLADLREDLARMKSLTNDLLEYGKARELRMERESLLTIGRAAADGCRAMAEPLGIGIEVEAEGNPLVRADDDALRQVFDNLLDNALQHSPAGSTVRLAVREETRHGIRVVVATISDEGPGFIPADLHRVFEPFYTRRTRGTGLGLSIVHKLVEGHDGTVTASNGEKGAIVEITLPAAEGW